MSALPKQIKYHLKINATALQITNEKDTSSEHKKEKRLSTLSDSRSFIFVSNFS